MDTLETPVFNDGYVVGVGVVDETAGDSVLNMGLPSGDKGGL